MHPPEAYGPANHSDAAKNERHRFEIFHVKLRHNDNVGAGVYSTRSTFRKINTFWSYRLMSVVLAKKFCERLHWFDVCAENLESGQDWHG
jgi:hypothetical protein